METWTTQLESLWTLYRQIGPVPGGWADRRWEEGTREAGIREARGRIPSARPCHHRAPQADRSRPRPPGTSTRRASEHHCRIASRFDRVGQGMAARGRRRKRLKED